MSFIYRKKSAAISDFPKENLGDLDLNQDTQLQRL